MTKYILSNAVIVTPIRHFSGSLIIEDGVIAEIVEGKNYSEGENLNGLWLVPGCIDIHSDYLEKELHPRPSADFPINMAFHFMDQRAALCGITTLFSAISFSEDEDMNRTFENAISRAREIEALRQKALIRHFIHARLNPNTDAVLSALEGMKSLESMQLVVYNENIPGQRQYDFEYMVDKMAKSMNMHEDEMRIYLQEKVERLQQINHRSAIHQALHNTMVLGSHDDASEAHIIEAKQHGATLAEMPTTLEAARHAKAEGLWVCMGAPNYLRGGSHCGNLSCADAIDENLVDMLCSDYHFPTMLSAVTKMIDNGISPSHAINYVSLNPAKMLKMDQYLGSIEEGKVADLVLMQVQENFAKVKSVWISGEKRVGITNANHQTNYLPVDHKIHFATD